jgi:ankyrin repeat protein
MAEQEQLSSKPAFPGAPGDFPARQTTSLTFIVEDGIVKEKQLPANKIDEHLETAYSILRREISHLFQSLKSSNVDRRLIRAVTNLSDSVRDDIQHVDVIRLGLEGRFLKAIYYQCRDEMSDYDAAITGEVINLHGLISNNMQRWRIFCLEAESLDISPEDAAFVKSQTKNIAHLLDEFADYVSSEVPSSLEKASDLIEPPDIDRQKPVLYALRSIENLVIVLLRNAQSAKSTSRDNSENENVKPHWIASATLGVIGQAVVELAHRFQDVLGWIPKILSKFM